MFYLYLERIELTGFKSFADKTIIEFDQGVTAIVGPNGSGKSNISEAVRWVLGEQSAKNLRGKKMNDIVFAGSETRRQINIAEVTLVLNNEDRTLPLDFTEVSLTRRINRNGDSDCFINKKPCRLKDITDLLMDSGIGKDSFSMISQGKVEQIFQNKPQERRAIFEDAAGVAKYKHRKTSAEKKLTATEEHLNRVEDILHEIENQLTPLEKQRNTAVKYKELRKELSDIEIALMVVEIEALNEQWQLSKNDIKHYQEEAAEMEKKQEIGEEHLVQLKHHVSKTDNELTVLQEKYVLLIQKIEQLEGQKNILEQKADFSAKNKEDQQKVLDQKQTLIVETQNSLKELVAEQKEKQATKKQLTDEIAKLEEKVTHLSQDKNEWIQQLRDRYIEKLQQQSTNKNTLFHLEKNQQQVEERLVTLTNKINELKRMATDAKEKLVQIKATSLTLQNKGQTQMTELEQANKQLTQEEAILQESNKTLIELSRELQKAEARRDSQQELEDSYANYYQGVKEILKRRDHIYGIRGPIGELFQVPDKYTLAIDTALGGSIQNIVVDDEKAASQAINILKRNRLGRATFLPLTVIKGKSLPSYVINDLERIPGYIGIGSDLISYDQVYANIAANSLGTTIVAEDLQSGLQLAKSVNNRYRIVSLEGDIIHAGGSMTGGATNRKQGNSVFSRKNTIEKLTNFIKEKTNEYHQLETTYKAKKSLVENLQMMISNLQNEAKTLQFELEKAQGAKERTESEVESFNNDLMANEFDSMALSQSQEEIKTDLLRELALKDTLVAEISELKQSMDDSTLNEEERQKRLQMIQNDLQQLNQKTAILQEQEKQLRRDIQLANQTIETETATVAAIQTNLEQAATLETTDFQSIDEVEESLVATKKESDITNRQLQEKRVDKKELDQQVKDEETALATVRTTLKKAWYELTKLESSASRSEVAIDHHLNRLSEEYGLSYEAANGEYNLTISTEKASKMVRELKQKIQALGPINLTSIEEYDRILERYEFLSSQQLDLVTAKETLLNTMAQMDEEVSLRFEKTFNMIKSQFEKTFPKLFGGGKATIELSDPSNLLETGIDIIAQPPGKKLQHLSLLSGGEKAFTAIALLFAIIEVSPVPFCILDEVEAALDESNVVRFGKYLASFEEETQFIVITHRKGTMEEADVLYGVTMQDSGVSRLASVKFDDYEVKV